MLEKSVFELMRNTLMTSRGLNLFYFDSPDANLEQIDMGIRAKLVQKDKLYDMIRVTLNKLEFGNIVLVRDPFLLTSLTFKADPNDTGFYSIGPFRSLPFETEDYEKIKTTNGLTNLTVEDLKYILQYVPCNITKIEAIAVAKNMLFFSTDCTEPKVIEKEIYSLIGDNKSITPVYDINDRIKRAEEIYAHEENLLRYISEGDKEKAFRESLFFTRLDFANRTNNRFLSTRSILFSTNTLFRKAAQNAGVHPIYLDGISQKFVKSISSCTTSEQLNAEYTQMIIEYCDLCQEHSTSQYSQTVKKIVNYISFNINNDITTSSIAEAVNYSPNYILRKFKEETGISLNEYIINKRINQATKLLDTTSMSIREICGHLGISDWNYFTKLFKKNIGMTPSEYKKLQNAKNIKK